MSKLLQQRNDTYRSNYVPANPVNAIIDTISITAVICSQSENERKWKNRNEQFYWWWRQTMVIMTITTSLTEHVRPSVRLNESLIHILTYASWPYCLNSHLHLVGKTPRHLCSKWCDCFQGNERHHGFHRRHSDNRPILVEPHGRWRFSPWASHTSRRSLNTSYNSKNLKRKSCGKT